MTDYVVDTNVWVTAGKPINQLTTQEEIICAKTCLDWLREFMTSNDRLVVDGYATRAILSEYRDNVGEGRIRRLLNDLERTPGRLEYKKIEFDENNHAIVDAEPLASSGFDRDDRKFVAAALAHHPTPPIVNAADTDWTMFHTELKAIGITLIEICPIYIDFLLKRKR